MREEKIWIENIDLKRIFLRFVAAWPLFILSFLFFSTISVLLIMFSPQFYEAKTSVIVEKPQGFDDPNRLIVGAQLYTEPETNFFVNEEVKLKSFSLIKQVVDSLNLFVTYYVDDFIIEREVYNSPFIVEFDKNRNPDNAVLPEDNSFECIITNENEISIEAELEYESRESIEISETVKTGQWIEAGDLRFKIVRIKSSVIKLSDFYEFSFVIKDPKKVVLSYIDNLIIKQEQVDATVYGIRLISSPKEKAYDFLNVLGNTYVRNHIEEKERIYNKALNYVDSVLISIVASLNLKEEGIKQVKTNFEITYVRQKSDIILRQISNTEAEKAKLKLKQQYLQYFKDYLANKINIEKVSSPSAFGIEDPLLLNLVNQLIYLQIEKKTLEEDGKEKHPSYKLISGKLTTLNKNVAEVVTAFEESYQIQEMNLRKQLAELKIEFLELPKAETELSKKTRLFNLDETLFYDLMQKKTELEISLASMEPDVQIIEKAYISSAEPVFPNTKLIFAIAFLLALIFPVAFLVLMSLFNDKISDEKYLQEYKQDYEIFGIIKSNIKNPDDFVSYSKSYLAEDFNMLSYKIQSVGKNKVISLIAQTALSGTSYLSSFLGLSLALKNSKVLILDVNYKRPKQHSFFSVNPNNSFIEYTQNKCSLEDAYSKTQFDDLYLMAFGNETYVESSVIEENLLEMKKHFDYIIIDNGAIEVSFYTFEFVKQADHSFIVSRRNHTGNKDFEKIIELFKSYSVQNSSVIFNYDFATGRYKKSNKKYFKNKRFSLKYRLFAMISRMK